MKLLLLKRKIYIEIIYVYSYTIGGHEKKISTIGIFKTGIRPEWEDPENSTGGDFQVKY